jgi:hypothetical protein
MAPVQQGDGPKATQARHVPVRRAARQPRGRSAGHGGTRRKPADWGAWPACSPSPSHPNAFLSTGLPLSNGCSYHEIEETNGPAQAGLPFLPKFDRPSSIHVVVAGAPAGKFSAFCPCFGMLREGPTAGLSRPVSRVIEPPPPSLQQLQQLQGPCTDGATLLLLDPTAEDVVPPIQLAPRTGSLEGCARRGGRHRRIASSCCCLGGDWDFRLLWSVTATPGSSKTACCWLAGWLGSWAWWISPSHRVTACSTRSKRCLHVHTLRWSVHAMSLALVAMSLLLVAWPPVAEGGGGGDTPRRMFVVCFREGGSDEYFTRATVPTPLQERNLQPPRLG